MKTSGMNGATTAIGSLPHHNVDAALACAFRTSIPTLPQIPIRNRWEYMIPQTLEGLPGLRAEPEGLAILDVGIWSARQRAWSDKMHQALEAGPGADLSQFEPSAATSSSWQAFLWELEEKRAPIGKIQLAGPLTCQWALKTSGTSPDFKTDGPELSGQIVRWILLRALAMGRRMKTAGIQPLIFLDEPGLYAFNRKDPRQWLAFQELGFVVKTLKREGIWVGIHCCGQTDWQALLELQPDVLSLDAGLSLQGLLGQSIGAEKFLRGGGRFALGVIPTAGSTENFSAQDALTHLESMIRDSGWSKDPELVHLMLSTALFTPACGLALQSVEQAENTVARLLDFQALVSAKLKREF